MSDTVTDTVDKLDQSLTVSLSVQLLLSYLARGYRQSHIADICGVSRQAVSDYIQRHYDELSPLLNSDSYLANRCRNLADKAVGKMSVLLDTEELTKRDLISLNAVSGTHIDKYRLLSGQSTQNIDYHDSTAKMSALDQEIDKLKQELGMSDDAIDITPVKPVKVEESKVNQDTIKDNNG